MIGARGWLIGIWDWVLMMAFRVLFGMEGSCKMTEIILNSTLPHAQGKTCPKATAGTLRVFGILFTIFGNPNILVEISEPPARIIEEFRNDPS
jgi:hypothetical protein